ncbi:MAG: HD domain-containing protein [Endomicrobium sp.]|jgi:poly(A) polymerase|nr:HD domain-containing protein [Endomicrobium sp.]
MKKETIIEAIDIIKRLNSLSSGFNVYIVGGFLRDVLLKRVNKHSDIDLVVKKKVLNYSEKIACKFKSKFVILNDINKTYRIMLKNSSIKNIDVSLLNGKTIEQDLQNRDFTINAIAINIKDLKDLKDLKNLNIYAPFGALNDYILKIINTTSVKSFEIDPLRMLRAFRLAAELGFTISKETFKQIRYYAKFINGVAPERIKNEFSRILSTKKSTDFIKKMDKCELISEIFDEIKVMKKVDKKYYYHSNGLFQHSFETMKFVEKILNNLKKYFPDNYLNLNEHFNNNNVFSENVTRKGLLKLAALFHDNAKPETSKFISGKIHFFGHEKLGAKKIKKIMQSIKFSKKDINIVSFLIENHMRLSGLTKNGSITKNAILRFFRDIGDNIPDIFILSMSDWYSYKRLKIFPSIVLKSQEKSVRKLMKYYYELKNKKPTLKIIDGNIIMKKFSLKQGPFIGKILNLVFEAQQNGEVSNTNEALELISSKLKFDN